MGMGKTISNPKVFTLDNQLATVTQGEEIPYQTQADGSVSTSFKEAALKLEVTPSIIGDGNEKEETIIDEKVDIADQDLIEATNEDKDQYNDDIKKILDEGKENIKQKK